jgi:hypothetical protein
MGTTIRNNPTRSIRSLRSRALLLGIAGAAILIAVPTVAQAATRSGSTSQPRHAGANTKKAQTSSICRKVSAASVSAIIGYKVPAPTSDTLALKPTKANYGISGTNTICTYGAETNMTTILKAVTLSYEVISKPLTSAEMQQSLKKASAGAKFKFSAYSGLGVPGYYFSLTEAGITGQGITGIADGTHFFSADVESKNVSKATIAALAKLAEQL